MDRFKFVILHTVFFMYSLVGIASKKASQESLFSFGFFAYYGVVICILFLYALVWQQLLKKMDVTTAYMNKAVTIIWGLFWGFLLFDEHITTLKIIGSLLIVLGVIIVVLNDKYFSSSD